MAESVKVVRLQGTICRLPRYDKRSQDFTSAALA